MKITRWAIKFRNSIFGTWIVTSRMSYSRARAYLDAYERAGYQARLVELTAEQWMRIPMANRRRVA